MASSNDHMSLPPQSSKARLSPLDFRNTELVSRLLAATPPYLYNMSLLPNSYFFSEMLRSLVQAKQESAANAESLMMSSALHSRRSRKRPWLISRPEEFSKTQHKVEKPEVCDWMKSQREKTSPSEPTGKSPEPRLSEEAKVFNKEKSPPFQMRPDQSNLILPPAPPIWFPPIYPSPYVDPLHFFIDLRVSGHIYDKSQKDCANFDRSNRDYPSTVVSSNSESERSSQINETSGSCLVGNIYGGHNSAFSVPSHKSNNSVPINLSQMDKEVKCTKFDVKSMGFEKNSNKIGTNYIVANIESIYKNISRMDNNLDGQMNECSEEKRAKMEDEETENGFKFFSDNRTTRIEKQNLSRGHSPLEVVDNGDQEFKIDIQI